MSICRGPSPPKFIATAKWTRAGRQISSPTCCPHSSKRGIQNRPPDLSRADLASRSRLVKIRRKAVLRATNPPIIIKTAMIRGPVDLEDIRKKTYYRVFAAPWGKKGMLLCLFTQCVSLRYIFYSPGPIQSFGKIILPVKKVRGLSFRCIEKHIQSSPHKFSCKNEDAFF